MVPEIQNYLQGFVVVQISGSVPEKFINLCLARNIILWNICQTKDRIYAGVRLTDFFRLRPIVRKSHTRLKVINRQGFPFLLKRIKQRKMLVAGALVFFMLLFILSSCVWRVEVTGIKSLDGGRIMAVVNQGGLKPGVWKKDVNTKQLEHEIILNIPEVAWTGISFTGTKAVIEVVEKTFANPETKAPGDIVAEKDGIITEIIVLAGRATHQKGDTVKKGDVLIEGLQQETVPPANQTALPLAVNPPVKVRAKGIIKARVWYESYGEAELIYTDYDRSGRQITGVSLTIGDRNIQLKTVPEAPFTVYETETVHKKLPYWRNSNLAVESTINTYYELIPREVSMTPEAARDVAGRRALAVMQGLVPETAQILARDIEVLKPAESNLVRVKVQLETVEDIGLTREY